MKIKGMRNKFRLVTLAIAGMVFITMTVIFLSVEGCTKMKNKDDIDHISFSPDGKKIIFDRCKDKEPCLIQLYNIETGELCVYQPFPDERWTMARFSFDGKHIVFSIIPRDDNKLDIGKMQIATMDPDGRYVRKITNGSGTRIYPSFLHSGRKVIYAKAGTVRKEGRTPAADYDVYEVDIETGEEVRLTRFKFFMMSPPYCFPDNETIIFSAYGPPMAYPGIPDNDYKSIQKKKEEYRAKDKMRKRLYDGDDVYVVRKDAQYLPKPFIESVDGTRLPLITRDGSHIYFTTQAYKADGKGDGEQIFEYEKNGKHRRITNIKPTSIWSAAVSPDGELLAVAYSAEDVRKILIHRVKDGSSREIILPDHPSRIINQVQ